MAPLQTIPILERWRRLPRLALSPPFWFHYFPRQNAEMSFKRAQSVNNNCLTTPHVLCCTHRLTRKPLQSKTMIWKSIGNWFIHFQKRNQNWLTIDQEAFDRKCRFHTATAFHDEPTRKKLTNQIHFSPPKCQPTINSFSSFLLITCQVFCYWPQVFLAV